MQIYYLEIVTPEVEATTAALAAQHGVSFSGPQAALGNARVAMLEGGGRIGVRAPLRDDEAPVVRPYLLVEDIEAASKAAEAAGADFAMRATEIPEQGTFAIYFLGGIQHGLWER
ncbi:MAG: hydroxylase [Pseudomonadota bacterium]